MPVSTIHRQSDLVALRRQGYRLTRQRLLILETLAHSGQHLSAEAIFRAVADRCPGINVATVYRNLQWLHGVGLVRRIDTGCGHLLWEYAEAHAHHHLICQRCHRVQEIDNHVVACLSDHVRDHYGFEVNLDHLAIFGICAACTTATQDSAASS